MKIAIISASQPCNENTGMLTVDLGAFLLKSDFPEAKFTWFSFPATVNKPFNDFFKITQSHIEFKYLPESLEYVYEHDHIFFWGDFLNSCTWMNESGVYQLRHHYSSLVDIRNIILKCMLFQDAPMKILKKTFIFGGTILSDRETQLQDEEYTECFQRLISNCKRIWMREPISAARVSILRDCSENCLGVDAAMLMFKRYSLTKPEESWKCNDSGKIGLFLGSRTTITETIFPFLERLEAEFHAELDWLPWFSHMDAPELSLPQLLKSSIKLLFPFPQIRVREQMRRFDIRSKSIEKKLRQNNLHLEDRSLESLLHRLSTYQFIVTDTYHVCVNAWRMGVPAICIGATLPCDTSLGGTLKDTKKYILYLTYYATDLYVTMDQLKDEQKVLNVIKILKSSQTSAIANRINIHTSKIKLELIEAIQGTT